MLRYVIAVEFNYLAVGEVIYGLVYRPTRQASAEASHETTLKPYSPWLQHVTPS